MMFNEFDKRRKRMVELLNAIPGVTCRTPKGAFYTFPNISCTFGKTFNGVHDLTIPWIYPITCWKKANIAVVPGSAFGAEGFLRFSYATSMANIEKGIQRMKEALQG